MVQEALVSSGCLLHLRLEMNHFAGTISLSILAELVVAPILLSLY
jgi:hypothetical protein